MCTSQNLHRDVSVSNINSALSDDIKQFSLNGFVYVCVYVGMCIYMNIYMHVHIHIHT